MVIKKFKMYVCLITNIQDTTWYDVMEMEGKWKSIYIEVWSKLRTPEANSLGKGMCMYIMQVTKNKR